MLDWQHSAAIFNLICLFCRSVPLARLILHNICTRVHSEGLSITLTGLHDYDADEGFRYFV